MTMRSERGSYVQPPGSAECSQRVILAPNGRRPVTLAVVNGSLDHAPDRGCHVTPHTKSGQRPTIIIRRPPPQTWPELPSRLIVSNHLPN
jgi:hypothetical protein